MRNRTTVMMVALAAICQASCGSPEAPTAVHTAAPAPMHAPTAPDPCALLAPREVEIVLGTLAGPPFIAATPNKAAARCIYESQDLHSIELTLVSTGGSALLRRTHPQLAAVRGWLYVPDGPATSGPWDAAAIDGCCRVDALRGDALISIDVLGSRATLPQAADLAGRALRRIDGPLAIDGTAGIAAAKQRVSERPHPILHCGILSRREVEAILGPLAADPEPADRTATSACTYRFHRTLPAAGGAVATIRYVVLWRRGYRAFRQSLAPPVGEGRLREADGAGQVATADAAWVQAVFGADRMLAVQRDVLVTVESEVFLGRTEHVQDLGAAIEGHLR